MIITYLRSSSYNSWDFCQHKYFLDYTLGFRSPVNKKGDKGTIVHKGLELLGNKKLAIQNNQREFIDSELGHIAIDFLCPDLAIQMAYDSHIKTDKHHDWYPDDLEECKELLYKALEFKNGTFNPLKRDIIAVEQYFDFEIKQPWAQYSYGLTDGSRLDGFLAMKGTLDLVTKQERGVVEIIDWKTGATKKDWATGKDKTFDKLRDDPQLRIYHYGASQIYPEADEIFITIYYIRLNEPITIPFDRSDLPETEKLIRARFETIRNTVRPKLIYPDWRCDRLCYFYRNKLPGESKNICFSIRDDLIQLGLDKTMRKHAQPGAFNQYGAGGGRSVKDD